jgi:diguanylate cyclase (GGDEF)-like protein
MIETTDGYADVFAFSRAGQRDFRLGGAIACAFVLAAAIVYPFASAPVARIGIIAPPIGTIVMIAQVTATVIFATNFTISRYPPLFYCALAYGVGTVLNALSWFTLPQILTGEPFSAQGSQAAAWFYTFARCGFLLAILLVIGCTAGPAARLLRTARAMIAVTLAFGALTIAGTVFAFALAGAAPALIAGTELTPSALRFAPIVAVAPPAVLVLWLAVTRLRHAIDIWIAVAIVALGLDIVLTIHGGSRASAGWIAGRALWAGSTIAVLLQMQVKMYAVVIALVGDNRRLGTEAATDELTQLANRRAFNAAISATFGGRRRGDCHVSLLMIDIDEFKRFNDRFGHRAGDAALQAVARAVELAVTRSSDIAARWGGEEFAVLLSETDARGALAVAERIRQRVIEMNIEHDAGASHPHLSVSIGIASTFDDPEIETFDALAELADAALFCAKAAGRNRVWAAPAPEAPASMPSPAQ